MDHLGSHIQKLMLDQVFQEDHIVTSIHLFKIAEGSLRQPTPESVPQSNLMRLQRAVPQIEYMDTDLGSANNRT